MADVYRIKVVLEVDVVTHESELRVRRDVKRRVREALTIPHGHFGSSWPLEGADVKSIRSVVIDHA